MVNQTNINEDVFTDTHVNKTTGEIISAVIITNPDKYEVVEKKRVKQKRYFAERKNRTNLYNKIVDGFTFSHLKTISKLHTDNRFKDDEKTRIMVLGTYVSYTDKGSFLKYANGHYVRKNHLMDLLHISKRDKFYSFYNKMVDAEIITEVKEGNTLKLRLKWSNMYHFKGTIPKNVGIDADTLIKSYDNQIRELFNARNERGRLLHSPTLLYSVFMVLPFVHYETNILCKYPNKPFDDCQPLTMNELAKGLGYSRSNDLKRKLLRINLKEQPVFSFNTTNKATHITVNPFVVWRQQKMPDASLLVSFYDTAKRIAESKGIGVSIQSLLE